MSMEVEGIGVRLEKNTTPFKPYRREGILWPPGKRSSAHLEATGPGCAGVCTVWSLT